MNSLRYLPVLLLPLIAHANGVGNGGDPLRLRFEEARDFAVERIQQAKACSFNVDTRPEVVAWIMSNQAALAQDVHASPHTWVTDPQATCAFTQTIPQAAVVLSFETCRPGIKDVTDALQIVVHESVHHFGIVDERFADEVGVAVARLGTHAACAPVPASDPFDPNSCPGTRLSAAQLFGMIPLPDSNRRDLGRFEATVRRRQCYGPHFCKPWEIVGQALRGYVEPDSYGANGYNYAHRQTGVVFVALVNNAPLLAISSDPADSPSPQVGSLPYWGSTSMINDQNELTTLALTSSGYGRVHLGFNYAKDEQGTDLEKLSLEGRIRGWMTDRCYRQAVAVASPTYDNQGNDLMDETEMVILSKF